MNIIYDSKVFRRFHLKREREKKREGEIVRNHHSWILEYKSNRRPVKKIKKETPSELNEISLIRQMLSNFAQEMN